MNQKKGKIELENRVYESRVKQFSAPVKVGEELEVSIDGVGVKGDGIARRSGYIIFVHGAKPGSRVRIRMITVLPKVGFANSISNEGGENEIEKNLEISPSGIGRDLSRHFDKTFRRDKRGSWNKF